MSNITDPYQILGVSPNATDDEVKKAYRELSRKYHPDANAGNPLSDLAEEKFKQVQEAYSQIMDMRNVHIAPFPPVLMFVSRRRMFAFFIL